MDMVLTGPVGARTNRPVALVTEDFRTYHELVPVFRDRGLDLLGLRPGEAVPEAVQALIGGPPGDPRSVALRSDAEATLLAVLQLLDGRRAATGGYSEVVFGVDPGKTIGLAVVAAGLPLAVAEAHGPEEVLLRLAVWRSGLDAQEWRIHIGDGSPEVGTAVAAAAARAMPDAAVVVVPETATTPYSPTTQSRHTDAAILIALRRP
jgi:hypothetical protein